MNEQIKELAEQARIKDYWSIDEGRYLTNYLDEQKFAKLIVEKCLTSLWLPKAEVNDLSKYNQGWVAGRLLALENIKKDFGIEK
jgi:hypothetical protein